MVGYNVYGSAYGAQVDEQTATASLDLKTTRDFNAKSFTTQNAIDQLTGDLLNKGYSSM